MNIEELRLAIEHVVAYNWSDELTDFENQEREGNPTDGHVLHDLRKLAEFIKW